MHRREFLGGLAACVACAGVGATAAVRFLASAGASELTNSEGLRAAAQPDAIFRVPTSKPLVGLTFDDGPDPAYTPAVADLLARHRATATFFLIGVNAQAYPDLVRRHVGDGHEVGNHTLDHADLELLSGAAVTAEITGGEGAIAGAGAPPCRLFRPPKGHTDEIVGVVADADRYRTIFWTDCVERAVDHASSPEDGIDRLVAGLRPGSIILAHDGGHVRAPGHPVVGRRKTVEALPRLLGRLDQVGLRPVSIGELLRSA